MKNTIIIILLLLLCTLAQLSTSAQIPTNTPPDNSKLVEILNSDELEVIEEANTSLRKLKGNVILQQGNMTMQCDSALLYYNENNVRAFGNVYIKQGDSVQIKSKRAFYNGNQRKANFNGNVFLTDGKTDIRSDSLVYLLVPRKATIYKNVELKDSKATVKADKVEYIIKNKQAYLYDKVDLTSTDGTKITTNKMDYNANTKQVELYNNSRLVEKGGMTIESDRMSYNMETKEGNYDGGGKLTNKETVLTSQKALYKGADKKVFFEDNVLLNTPEYKLQTPKLDYDIATQKAQFKGASTITNADGTINANAGTYNPQTNQLELNERTTITQKTQQLTADNLFYDKKTGYTKAVGKVILHDTKQNITLNSKFLNIYDKDKRVVAYQDVLLTQIVDNDTLRITADTLISFNKAITKPDGKTDSVKNILAHRHVKILKSDLQGICDSLAYTTADSTFRLYYNPILWSDDYQLYADTIFLATQNNAPKQIYLNSNAFMGNRLQDDVYNQIKGKNITGFFVDKKIDHVFAQGNAESVYFVQNEKKEYSGVNKASAGAINMFFTAGKADKIKYITQPSAVFYPMKEVRPRDFILRGFEWKEKQRPKLIAFL